MNVTPEPAMSHAASGGTAGVENRPGPARTPYGRAMNVKPEPETNPAVSADGEAASPVVAAANAHPANPSQKFANESLANESRTPAIPFSNLVFPYLETPDADDQQIVMASAVADNRNNISLERKNVLVLPYDEPVLPVLSDNEYYAEKVGDTMRYSPPTTSVSTSGVLTLTLNKGEDWGERYAVDRELTWEAIEWQADWNQDMRHLAAATVARQQQLLRRFFNEPFIEDPELGLRPPTLRELLQPDFGRLIVMRASKVLWELSEGLAIDLLSAVRRFARFICTDGAALPSGANLRELWGGLACPLGDRDIPKRKPQTDVFLPTIEGMKPILGATHEWALAQRKQVTALRTATFFVTCMATGIRGVEGRNAMLSDQTFDRRNGVSDLRNVLAIRSAKGGAPREVQVDSFGFEMLMWWLAECRPLLVGDDLNGPFFPSSGPGHRPISSSSLTDTTGRLLDALKQRGLLHESFTFHATRKTYATHFLERNGTDVSWLLQQCGWGSAAQLPVYLRPSNASIGGQRDAFTRSQGVRRGKKP